jgi:hypothetical protein
MAEYATVSQDQWTMKLQDVSARYFAHNLRSTVKFNEVLKNVPTDTIAIEIAPRFNISFQGLDIL